MQITSRDKEMAQIRTRWGLSPKTTFFLLDRRDLNLSYHGLFDHESLHVTNVDATEDRLAQLAAQKKGPSIDSALAEKLGDLCAERRGATNFQYWRDLAEVAQDPSRLIEVLRKKSYSKRILEDLVTLVHVVPQSVRTGIVKTCISGLIRRRGESAKINDTAPWDGTEGTLVVLRTLEYLFGIGSPGSRDALVTALHSPVGIFQGLVISYDEPKLDQKVLTDIETTLDALSQQEFSTALRKTANDESSLFGALAESSSLLLPVYSTLHWQKDAGRFRLLSARTLPLKPPTLEPSDILSRLTLTDYIQEDYRRWFAREVEKTSERGVLTGTFLGSSLLSQLPGSWTWAATAENPLGAKACLTFLSDSGANALQLLLVGIPEDSLSDQDLGQRIARHFNTGRILSATVASSDRFPGSPPDLPASWVYAQTTASSARAVIRGLRGAWAGEAGAENKPLLLLSGPAGTGKSSFAKWMAEQVVGDRSPLLLTADLIKGPHPGDSEKALAKIISELMSEGPRVIIVDEIEQFAMAPSGEPISTMLAASFKGLIDKLFTWTERHPSSRVLLVASTNYRSSLDKPFLERCMEVKFEWGHEERSKLLEFLKTTEWTESAQRALLGKKNGQLPRTMLRIVAEAQAEAETAPRSLHAGPPVVDSAHVETAYGRVVGEDEPQVSSDSTQSTLVVEYQEFRAKLDRLVEQAREQNLSHQKDLELDPLWNNTILAFVNREFPSFSHELNMTLKNNRPRPRKPVWG